MAEGTPTPTPTQSRQAEIRLSSGSPQLQGMCLNTLCLSNTAQYMYLLDRSESGQRDLRALIALVLHSGDGGHSGWPSGPVQPLSSDPETATSHGPMLGLCPWPSSKVLAPFQLIQTLVLGRKVDPMPARWQFQLLYSQITGIHNQAQMDLRWEPFIDSRPPHWQLVECRCRQLLRRQKEQTCVSEIRINHVIRCHHCHCLSCTTVMLLGFMFWSSLQGSEPLRLTGGAWPGWMSLSPVASTPLMSSPSHYRWEGLEPPQLGLLDGPKWYTSLCIIN